MYDYRWRCQVHKLTSFIVLLALAIFAVACSGNKKPEVSPANPTTTDSVDIEASPEEQDILIRAIEIQLEEAKKKAKASREKLDSPYMRQARKEIEEAKKAELDAEKTLAQSRQEAEISGCDPATVFVEERAGFQWTITSIVKVRVHNPYPVTVDIEDEDGVVVRGLCPNGRVTVMRRYNKVKHGNSAQFFYTPVANSGSWTGRPFRFSMNKNDAKYRRLKVYTWEISMRKQK